MVRDKVVDLCLCMSGIRRRSEIITYVDPGVLTKTSPTLKRVIQQTKYVAREAHT